MQLNARIKHKRDTASNWATKNPTPLDGEIIIVEATDGTTRLKVGDGSTKYASLPFLDEDLATQVSTNTSNISTLTNTKVTGVTSATSGNVVVFDGTGGRLIKDSGKSLSSYLPLDGGTMTGDITFNAKGKGLKWTSSKNNNNDTLAPYIGYCTNSGDGTFVIGSLLGTTYQSGLALGGSSGNLLWKGNALLTTASAISASKVSGTVASAEKATKDASGNVITSTYATKSELNAIDVGVTSVNGQTGDVTIEAGGLSPSGGTFNGTTEIYPATDTEEALTGTVFNAADNKSMVRIGSATELEDAEGAPLGGQLLLCGPEQGGTACLIGGSPNGVTGLFVDPVGGFGVSGFSENGFTLFEIPPNKVPNCVFGNLVTSVNGVKADDKGNVTIEVGGNDYTLPVATSSTLGGVTIGSNISVSNGKISLTKSNVTSALGYTPLQSYTLPTASSSTLGGVKTTSTVTSTSGLTACPIIGGVPYYKDTNNTYTLSSFGITATSTELNYCDGVTSNIQTQLNGKLNSSANASSASKLATARTISLSGAVSGSASFDGSKNVTISTTSGQHISNKGSGNGYIKLGTMVADDSGNFGNFTFSGRFGGWEQGNSANYEIMMLNRSSARDGNTITATVSSSGEVANALSVCDIVVYKQTDTTSVVYLKVSSYWLYDFDWSAYQHSIVYDGTSTTTTPTGTLIWSLSGAPKTILDASGKLSINGGNIGGHVYLTGAQENSSTSNTSQIVFGTADNNHVAISSNNNALVINPDTSTTANQIVLYLDKPSVFPSGIQGNLTGTASKATSDGSGNNIANTYITKSSANSSFIGGSRGELDIDTLYDVGNHMIAKGSNCPSANEYGVTITLPYRKLKGNSIPDFGAQIFIPNGDDDTKPNSMFFRTSLANSWNAWQEVMTRGMVQSSTTDLTAGSSALADGNIYLVYE